MIELKNVLVGGDSNYVAVKSKSLVLGPISDTDRAESLKASYDEMLSMDPSGEMKNEVAVLRFMESSVSHLAGFEETGEGVLITVDGFMGLRYGDRCFVMIHQGLNGFAGMFLGMDLNGLWAEIPSRKTQLAGALAVLERDLDEEKLDQVEYFACNSRVCVKALLQSGLTVNEIAAMILPQEDHLLIPNVEFKQGDYRFTKNVRVYPDDHDAIDFSEHGYGIIPIHYASVDSDGAVV